MRHLILNASHYFCLFLMFKLTINTRNYVYDESKKVFIFIVGVIYN